MIKRTFIFFFVVFLFCYYLIQEWPDKNFHLVFCDVGQGDAILLTQGFTQILIDGGKDQSVMKCLGEKMPFWDKKVEIVIATHPDADHIGGLSGVFEQYQVDLIITNGNFKNSADFDDFKKGVSRKQLSGTKHFILSQNSQIQLFEKISLTALWPEAKNLENGVKNVDSAETELWDTSEQQRESEFNHNNGSIVLFLTYKNFTALLTGDLEMEGETALVDAGLIKEAHLLKIAHHGSKTSTTQNFVLHSRPEVSVVSSGKNNSYGHPAKEILDRLERAGSQIVRTDTDGSIEYVTDGTKVWRE